MLGAWPFPGPVNFVGPITTDRLAGSKLKNINFFNKPVRLLGGLPGNDTFVRLPALRMDRLAVILTNAPNLENTRRVALSMAFVTAGMFRKSLVFILIISLV